MRTVGVLLCLCFSACKTAALLRMKAASPSANKGMRVEGETLISPRRLRQASTKALSWLTLAIASGSTLFICASG